MNVARADMNSAAAEWRDAKQRQIDELVGRRDQKTEEKRRTDGNYDATLQNKSLDMQSAQAAERSRRESEEIKKTQMEKGNIFLLNFQILEYAVWQRDKNGNLTDTTQLCFLWLIRLLFFIIEILPTVVKIVTPVGSYDRVVYAQEKSMKDYLDSPEFLDSMREIHKSELQTQLEEAKLRQEAELQMKKDILEKMTAAQIDVANLAIAKWEENERKKFTGKDGAGTTDPSVTATGLDTDSSMPGIATVINSNSSLS